MRIDKLMKNWAVLLPPDELEKQKLFYDVHIRHPKLDEVIEQMVPSLTPFSESNITVVCGATGVGKSALAKYALKKIYAANAEKMQTDKSAIPVIAVEAYTSGDSRQIFRQLYEDMLQELHEPAIAKKGVQVTDVDGRVSIRYDGGRPSLTKLRKLVQNAMENRGTQVCVIDEAYHLLKIQDDESVLDTLKSLANLSGAKIVLVGSYDLYDLIDAHAQVARRTTIFHFDRYRIEDTNDKQSFKEAVGKLVAKWPCDEKPNLAAISDELLEMTLGCVGLLKSMLLDITARQLLANGRWNPNYLGQAARAIKLREIIRREIELGEAKVRDALFGQSMWTNECIAKLARRMDVGRG